MENSLLKPFLMKYMYKVTCDVKYLVCYMVLVSSLDTQIAIMSYKGETVQHRAGGVRQSMISSVLFTYGLG